MFIRSYNISDQRIYLDYNATAPINPEAQARALPFLSSSGFGNPSSLHREGQHARAALNRARAEMAGILGCQERELVFTSGATEALNHVIMRAFYRSRDQKGHIITTRVEHLAVLEPCRFLESRGWEVTYLGVDGTGRIDPGDVKKALRPDTCLISVIHAHNEIGTLQPVEEVGRVARAAHVPFMTDAVQSLGKVPLDLAGWGASFAVFSAHKIGGFKGTGLLYAHRDQDAVSFIYGGHQERGMRGGTENVAGIVAFAEAAICAERNREKEARRVSGLRDRLQAGIEGELEGLFVSGHPTERLPNTLHIAFQDLESEKLLMSFDMAGISVSNGSACNSGSAQPSHVMDAVGMPERFRRGTVRFSLGPGTTVEEIDRTIHETVRIIRRLQKEKGRC